MLLPLRFTSGAFDASLNAPQIPKRWTRPGSATQRITNKAKGLLDAPPDYYSFHVITGQVDETMKVSHVTTRSIFIWRGTAEVQNANTRQDSRGKSHFGGQLSTKYWIYRSMQFQLHRNVKTQLVWPLVVEGYMMFHNNRVVVRPGANLICSENRNHLKDQLSHSFLAKLTS